MGKMMLLLCTLLLVLSACSSGGSKSGSSAGTAETSTETSTETAATNTDNKGAEEKDAEQTYKTPDMDFDMGGRTIKVVSWWDMTIPEDNPDNIQRKKIWRSWRRSITSKSNTSRSIMANTSKK